MIAAYAAVMSLVAAIASGLAVPLASLADLGWRFSLLCWGLPALLALLIWLPQLRRTAIPAAKEPQSAEPQRYRSPWGSALGWQVAMFMGLQSIAFYTIIGWFSAFAVSHGASAQQAGFELFVYQVVAIVANFVMVVILPRARDQRAIALGSSLLIFIGVGGLLVQPASSLVWLTLPGWERGVRWCWRCRSLDCAVSIIIRRRCCRAWRNPSVICWPRWDPPYSACCTI